MIPERSDKLLYAKCLFLSNQYHRVINFLRTNGLIGEMYQTDFLLEEKQQRPENDDGLFDLLATQSMVFLGFFCF